MLQKYNQPAQRERQPAPTGRMFRRQGEPHGPGHRRPAVHGEEVEHPTLDGFKHLRPIHSTRRNGWSMPRYQMQDRSQPSCRPSSPSPCGAASCVLPQLLGRPRRRHEDRQAGLGVALDGSLDKMAAGPAAARCHQPVAQLLYQQTPTADPGVRELHPRHPQHRQHLRLRCRRPGRAAAAAVPDQLRHERRLGNQAQPNFGALSRRRSSTAAPGVRPGHRQAHVGARRPRRARTRSKLSTTATSSGRRCPWAASSTS